MLELVKATGQPLAEGLSQTIDMPHTISYAIIYRSRINGLNELPKDKRPPRNLWDKPYKLKEFLDDVFKTDKKDENFIQFNPDEVE